MEGIVRGREWKGWYRDGGTGVSGEKGEVDAGRDDEDGEGEVGEGEDGRDGRDEGIGCTVEGSEGGDFVGGEGERMVGMKRMVKVHRMEGMKGLGEDGGWEDER